jgi:hypothetical protein
VGIVGDSLEVTHSGGSDGSVVAIVMDPYSVTGHDYKVNFYDETVDEQLVTFWKLTDETEGSVVLTGQSNQSGDEDYAIADGLLVKAMGPPLLGKEWSYSGTRWFSYVNGGLSIFSGGIGLGWEFFGSTLTAADYKKVEIRFSQNQADWTNCKVYERPGSAVRPERGTFPGSAWDVDSSPARRLNICFVEWTGSGHENYQWDLDDTDVGGREYLFIMDSDYDAVTAGGYDDDNWGPGADVQWAYWGRLRPGHVFLEDEGTLTLTPNYVNTAADVFTFTAPDVPQAGDEVEKANLDKINVVPNPYFAFNPQERIATTRFVTFTHLPERGATIRIFTLDGTLVKVIDDDERARTDQAMPETIDSPIAYWYLRNEGDVPVASGMYIAHIEVEGVGDKVLKMAVFMPEERLDYF